MINIFDYIVKPSKLIKRSFIIDLLIVIFSITSCSLLWSILKENVEKEKGTPSLDNKKKGNNGFLSRVLDYKFHYYYVYLFCFLLVIPVLLYVFVYKN